MQSTHSSSSGSSLEDKDPTSLSFLPPMVASLMGWTYKKAQSEGAHWCTSWRPAWQDTEQGRGEDLKGQKEAGQRGSCHSITCSLREASNPQSHHQQQKEWREESWWQVFFPYPETAAHNQLNTAVRFPVNLENPCWNAVMFIYIFWSRNPTSRNLP